MLGAGLNPVAVVLALSLLAAGLLFLAGTEAHLTALKAMIN